MVVERRLAPGELVRADQAVALKLAQLDPLNVEVIVPARKPLRRGANTLDASASCVVRPVVSVRGMSSAADGGISDRKGMSSLATNCSMVGGARCGSN